MNPQIVIVSSRVPTEPYYHYKEFMESLRRFGETPVNLGEGQEWRGLMTKPYLLREWLRQGRNTSDRLIVCDAWDIVFTQHPHGISDRIEDECGDGIVFNAEKGCWPRDDLRDCFPGDKFGPWRFLNSGFFCGPSNEILKVLEAMDIESIGFDPPGGPYPNDQGEYQALFSKRLELGLSMGIDTCCEFAQTLSACELSEFDFSGPPSDWRNLITDTNPGVWHGNGSGKNLIMPTIFEKMGL